MGTHWERGNKTNNLPPASPSFLPSFLPATGEFFGPLMSACWAFSLAAWNFCFQNPLSPFLTWANGRGTNCGTSYLVVVWRSCPHSYLLCLMFCQSRGLIFLLIELISFLCVPSFFLGKICWCEFLSFVVCAVGCKLDEHTKPDATP